MFFDTDHNSVETVISSLRGAFSETALKMWAYLRCMPKSTQITANLILGKFFPSRKSKGSQASQVLTAAVVDTIKKVVDIAFLILTSKWRKMRFEKYACEIRKAQVIA
jgi:hypothetical protein